MLMPAPMQASTNASARNQTKCKPAFMCTDNASQYLCKLLKVSASQF